MAKRSIPAIDVAESTKKFSDAARKGPVSAPIVVGTDSDGEEIHGKISGKKTSKGIAVTVETPEAKYEYKNVEGNASDCAAQCQHIVRVHGPITKPKPKPKAEPKPDAPAPKRKKQRRYKKKK
jgi:hypothetical protein